MLLRRFNQLGVDQFRAFIGTLKAEKTLPAPFDLLTDDALTDMVVPNIDCPETTFANRLGAAEYLDKLLAPVGLADAFNDGGLWSWLALRFYDELMPFKKAGIPQKDLKRLGVDRIRSTFRAITTKTATDTCCVTRCKFIEP